MAAVVAPPTVTAQEACVTRGKGICCAALTQLGATRAAEGFRYTTCQGKVLCMKCGTKPSTSKAHPGQTVFVPRRATCGISGCAALSAGGQRLTGLRAALAYLAKPFHRPMKPPFGVWGWPAVSSCCSKRGSRRSVPIKTGARICGFCRLTVAAIKRAISLL